MTDKHAIAPLTKVTLTLRAAPVTGPVSACREPVDFTFIYGIGTEGLTDFEMALTGLNSKDALTLAVHKIDAQAQFEHLLKPLTETLQTQPPFKISITVKSVTPATNRELVTALTQKVNNTGDDCGGGCGGGCGCGC